MEFIRFVFWEAVKIIALAFLCLVSAKAVSALAVRKAWIKPALYAVILALASIGAWYAGNDVTAEAYLWRCNRALARGDLANAYGNAIQAISVRPDSLSTWGALVQTKIRLQQFQSALDDEPAVRALSKGDMDEEDEYQFALCSHFLGQNDSVVATTLRLIRQNPSFAAPYVLQGLAYTAEKKFPEAQQSFLGVLQIFPSNEAAVEGLARAFYLGGDRRQALAVLDETAKFPFPPSGRQRFEALKGLYGQ